MLISTFGEPKQLNYDGLILIKESSFKEAKLTQHYTGPLAAKGFSVQRLLGMSLKYDGKTIKAKDAKEYITQSILPVIDKYKIKTLYVADSTYFKYLTGKTKVADQLGYEVPCSIDGYEHVIIIYGLNYSALFYNPDKQTELDTTLKTLHDSIVGLYIPPGGNIIHSATYPDDDLAIGIMLKKLLKYPALTCDVETFGLSLDKCGLGTIAFAWNKHNGTAFCVDYKDNKQVNNPQVKLMLKQFFETYTGKLIFHNITFDAKVLISELFMQSDRDYKGLVDGLQLMFNDAHCTKIITYLATNSTARGALDLKSNVHEWTGKYSMGEDIKDIKLINKDNLLEYNLIDCLSTWYLHDKNHPKMIKDDQLDIYQTIFQPTMKIITHTELIGMCVDMVAVRSALKELMTIQKDFNNVVSGSSMVTKYEDWAQTKAWKAKNHESQTKIYKREAHIPKVYPRELFDDTLNPGSNKQVGELLHDYLKLPVYDFTKTKQPAVGVKNLQKQRNILMSKFAITEDDLK